MTVATQRNRTAVLAMGLGCLCVLSSLTTVVLALLNRGSLPSIDAADPISVVVPLGLGAVGALVAWTRPRNPSGWLLLICAAATGLQGVESQYARLALVTHPGSLPAGAWALWVDTWSISLVYPAGAVALLLLLLPDGRLPSRRWRPLVVACVGWSTVMLVLNALAPGPLNGGSSSTTYATPGNPIGLPALAFLSDHNGTANGVLWIVGLVILLTAAAAPLVRMRRSLGDERQQLKWIAYAVLATALASLAMSLVGPSVPAWAFDLAIVLGFGVAFPLATAIAIFKYRLYDIDVVISRTLVYGTLAVFITGVYVGIAVGIGTLVGSGGKPNLGLSILATAIVAVGFQPVRERVQRVANRLVYGERATPYEVLAQFSERVAESYAVDDVMPRMARVLAEGTGAEAAQVWLHSGTAWHVGAAWPAGLPVPRSVEHDNGQLPAVDGASRVVEVRHQGDLLGALSVQKRAGEALTPVEESLLTHLAGQAGLVLKNVGLTGDLQARLEELRASRQRLVTAQDEERRRLERNLHDGAQQHLVALKVKLGLAEMLMGRDVEKAKTTLDQLKGDADEALETLRDLARGIYPPLLADKGLQAALESQVRKATVPVTVSADRLGRYTQDVEGAVYFAVLEALQNVQKYAAASTASVRLAEQDGTLRFTVDDDGAGFDPATTPLGSGLTNMTDRLDAVGGGVTVTSAIGQGTSVAGWVAVVTPATPPSEQRTTPRQAVPG